MAKKTIVVDATIPEICDFIVNEHDKERYQVSGFIDVIKRTLSKSCFNTSLVEIKDVLNELVTRGQLNMYYEIKTDDNPNFEIVAFCSINKLKTLIV